MHEKAIFKAEIIINIQRDSIFKQKKQQVVHDHQSKRQLKITHKAGMFHVKPGLAPRE